MEFPKVARIVRRFEGPTVADVEGTVKQEIRGLAETGKLRVKPGARIAVAVGSRGVADIQLITKTTVAVLRELGADPFIVPAMGSHGGATAPGQAAVLAGYGITPETVGAPVRATMEVVQLGTTSMGVPVYLDRIAFESDGIVPVNRVKKHTDFRGRIESGLMKMLAIGLGKEAGASAIHSVGPPNLAVAIPEVAELIMAKAPVLFGMAVVENGYGKVAKLKAIPVGQIRAEEEKLLELAKDLSPVVPVDADVLVVDEMGKEISGGGMDSNVIGRIRIRRVPEPDKPDIFRVVVLNMTDKSEGNASGLGIADFTTKRLVDKIDFRAFYTNEVASAMTERGKVPIALATDLDAIKAALLCCWMVPPERARIVRIKNTMALDEFYASEPLLGEVAKLPGIVSIGPLEGMEFGPDGSIRDVWQR